MIAVLYNTGDHGQPGGVGTTIFPMGEITLAKHTGNDFSIVFTDEIGGCPVEVQLSDELLFHLLALRDDPHPTAVMLIEENPGLPLPDGWETPF